MPTPSITCPHCGREIEITQALTHSIEEKLAKKYKSDMDSRLKAQEEVFREKVQELEEKAKTRASEVEAKAREQIMAETSATMDDLRQQLKEEQDRAKESAARELNLLHEKKALELRAEQLDLEVARRMEEERMAIVAAVSSRKDEEHRLKEVEREHKLADLSSQVATLKDQEETQRKRAQELEEQAKIRIADAEAKAIEKAKSELGITLEMLQQQVRDQDEKLKTATARELKLLQDKRDLEIRAEQLDLEVARKIEDERKSIASEIAARKDEEHRLREAEKEHKISDLLKQIEDLKRRAEQGSQQTQGEVQELELEKMLCAEFPHDALNEISKGVRGADCMQEVFTPGGQSCGKILWESKRTKNWNNAWVDKLKEDQREAKADIAVIVSQAMPEGLRHVGHLGGIWVCDFASTVGMAYILRGGLVQVAIARASVVGKNEKMEMLYEYLSGAEFRHAVQGVIEAFTQMKDDLESEKRATERQWAKREKQSTKAIVNMARMYGGIQGIVGKALPTIPALELPGGEEI